MVKKINLNSIRIDGGTQSRVEINNEAVSDYAEAVKAGIEFPPVVVFFDGADHWLADGFHRFHAHKQAGKASIAAEVRQGALIDAKLYALGANGTHGLRRSNADKRKAVQMALQEPAWAAWSDRNIAEACGVSAPFVAGIRRPPESPKNEAFLSTVEALAVDKRKPFTPEQPAQVAGLAKPKRTLDSRPADVEELTGADELAEAQHTIQELAQENEQLRDKLAVESMDGSEAAKTEAAEIIRDLRAKVNTLEAELSAVKASRDTHLRENAELKKQVAYWRKKAEKVAA